MPSVGVIQVSAVFQALLNVLGKTNNSAILNTYEESCLDDALHICSISLKKYAR